MQAEKQVVPICTPDSAYAEDVFTVIQEDGSTDAAKDPKLTDETVVELYQAMVRTRAIDLRLEKLQRQGRVGFHVGSLGEEACILASAAALRPTDWIFPCYREFGALLYRGFPLQAYLDNMYGNAVDQVQGRQMPDHYTGKAYHFGSVSSPIGTQLTQAVGFAWAAKLKAQDVVTGVYFGDGATSSSEFHCAMNFAGVFKIPTVFLCRNNRWAISVPAERQTASKDFASKAEAYGMPGVRCDGNDALATYRTVREAVERAARGEGPTLIELVTYRMGGHSTSDDPRAYRVDQEVEGWQQSDPILRLRTHLVHRGLWDDAQEETWQSQIETELKSCIEQAEARPKPPIASLFHDVLERQPWHLKEQQEACEAGPRPEANHG
ncbi:MAG: thiamine pyrophosphate-dependent enzyme [Myxococcota bacterium]